jgi:hypothetical protein
MNAPCPPNPNFPPFPLNPVVGQRWLGWVWNGSQWVQTPATGMQVLTTVFNASGPYMPSPGLVSVTVECIGAGGGGGSATAPAATGTGAIVGGGGGGSGGLSRKTLPASLVLGGVVVTVGAGGAGSAPGTVTSFGALCVANGGGAGGNNNVSSAAFGNSGPGATPGVGDVAFPGSAGAAGTAVVMAAFLDTNGQGGMGGWIYGGNMVRDTGPGAANPGSAGAAGTGAGGQGGCCNQVASTAGTQAGGAGGSGLCIVTEYCWADVAPGEDCGCAPGARVAGGFDEC